MLWEAYFSPSVTQRQYGKRAEVQFHSAPCVINRMTPKVQHTTPTERVHISPSAKFTMQLIRKRDGQETVSKSSTHP